MASPIEVFLSYAHKDEVLLNDLVTHLKVLRRQGFIKPWYDRQISPGTDFVQEIDKYLKTAQVILLVISPDFIASDYCYLVEVKQAVKRHRRGEARVIPVLLRPVYWKKAPFGRLEPLPTNYVPITSWSNRDEAFFAVAEGIRQVAEELTQKP